MGDVAQAVVVGGGAVGGWCAVFLKRAGLKRVVLVEQGRLGCGASSKASGMVRAQGGTEMSVRLGMWTRDFYARQAAETGFDCGFVSQGYFIPAFDEADVAEATARLEVERAAGLSDVQWLDRDEAERLNPSFARGVCRGGTYSAGDGYMDAARNVLAYALALKRQGVEVREGAEFLGLEQGRRLCVMTTAGEIPAEKLVLACGARLSEAGRRAGAGIPVGAVPHQVAVTCESPAFDPACFGPMVYALSDGLYWRPAEGGLLFGMSSPDDVPGERPEVDFPLLERMRRRLGELVPAAHGVGLSKVYRAALEYTSDHLPIVGPALSAGKDRSEVPHLFIASAGGHGMMWGPAVAHLAAEAVLGRPGNGGLGLERFDEAGRSRLAAEPVALPFPDPFEGGG